MANIPAIESIDLSKPYRGPAIVSPQGANYCMTLNLGNRVMRRGLVATLKQMILNGEWQNDHPQPIVFSDAKRMIDGQHRIQAIIEANMSVIVNVVINARDAVRQYIDTGSHRRLEDRVSFVDDAYVNRNVSQVVTCWIRMKDNSTQRPSASQSIQVFEEHKAAIMFAASTMQKNSDLCAELA